LTTIGQTKDKYYLLQSIVEPDAAIAENFATVVLLTDEGQVLSGILKRETDTLIELIDAEGKLIQVQPAHVESRQIGKSSMPVDLLKHLTRRELRDLVAYLASLTEPRQP
jgi:quinoprotein glucose dehydrogenase